MRTAFAKVLLLVAVASIAAGMPVTASANVCIGDCDGTGGGEPPPPPPPPITFSINDVKQLEGSGDAPIGFARTKFNFTVTRNGNPKKAVTVKFKTDDGSATAPSDYDEKSGAVSFAADETTKKITVKVVADFLEECKQGEKDPCKERFFVLLSNPSLGTVDKGKGVGTIVNDDGVVPPP